MVGGGRGIGAAVSRALGRRGDPVIVIDQRPEARHVAAGLPPGSRDVLGDAADTATIASAVQAAAATGCQPRTLAYLAFHQPEASLAELHEADWDRAQQVGSRAAWRWIVAFARAVPAGDHASIVLIGSIQAFRAAPAHAAYSVDKSALHALARSCAVELGPQGIRCNVVAPGMIAVERNADKRANSTDLSQMTKEIPLGRLGSADDVADAVAFLASNRATFINGACLTVDGGRSCAW